MTTDPKDDVAGEDVATGDQAIGARSVPRPTRGRLRDESQPIQAVLDEALICHVGYLDDGGPVVVPSLHARIEQTLYLHTSSDSGLARLAADGTRLCVTVSLLDGLVLGRSQFNHSMNYRSVIARGEGTLVTGDEEKRTAIAALVDHVAAGRSRHSRPPNEAELAATALVRLPLTDVILNSRAGPPVDDRNDLGLYHWAGVIGIRNAFGPAFPAPDLPYDRPVPPQLANYSRSARPHGYR